MSKIVIFAGPSLYGLPAPDEELFDLRPPAVAGDILQAVEDGATAIGLIDGQFEQAASVWHKEVLFALNEGIMVAGASSIGALRAAECCAFGMVGSGMIFRDYVSGRRTSDADVALLHAPEELQFKPLTVPLVDLDATLAAFLLHTDMSQFAYAQIWRQSRKLHYKERTWEAIAQALPPDILLPEDLLAMVDAHSMNRKGEDALQLLTLLSTRERPKMPAIDWEFSHTHFVERLWRSAQADRVST